MVYFDNAATSPMPETVIEAWTRAVRQVGNASSTHRGGQRVRLLWEEGRDQLAVAIGARPFDLTLTGSGTESINLAIKGLFAGRQRDAIRPRILSTEADHHATLDTLRFLEETAGAVIEFVAVDSLGRVDLADFEARLGPDVALVTTLWTNNEVGTIQPVSELVALAAVHGIPVHLDAIATLGYTPIDFESSGLAALSVSAHKAGGPVGVGALAVARGAAIDPLVHGGSQQRLRSGSLDAAGVHAAGVAASLVTADLPERSARLVALRDRLSAGVLATVPGAVLRGHPVERSPGNVHVTVPGLNSASALFLLDEAGFAVSAGSACQAGVQSPSHVLRAMGVPDADGPLRFTLGSENSADEIDALLALLPDVVVRASSAS